jgi:predicted DNA-binding transcriptional regulator YafY
MIESGTRASAYACQDDVVRDTSARMLALLSLLQARPEWPGPELAERLGVSDRTIRNDVARLRDLGYPVDAARGATGHYRLGVGAKLPPLLLDDEEAVAVAVGLRAGNGVAGIEEASARALAKLEQVLPHRLRRRVGALHEATSQGPENTGSNVQDPQVDAEVLATLAAAVRDHERVRLDHPPDGGRPVVVEPYRLVSWQRRWFLVGRVDGRWRTLRVDRLTLRMPMQQRFTPDPLPEQDYTPLVLREVAAAGWSVHARITVLAPAAEVLARINPAVGVVEAVDDTTSVLVTGADSLEVLAVYIGMLGLEFRVDGPPDLVEHLRAVGDRYARAVPP